MPRTREPGRVATGKTIVPPVEATMRGGPPPTRTPPEIIGHAEGPPRESRETIDLRTGEKRPVSQEGVIAIDPGDVHCGMALGIVSTNGQFSCVRAWEATPDECADEVAGWLLAGELAAVVVERFSLYADKAATQVGSTMPTAELIGILKYLVRVAGNASLVLQGADIKKSMRSQLKARGIKLLPAEADHARDAQLHLWYHAGRNYLGWGA
jgi:hypothetical protein